MNISTSQGSVVTRAIGIDIGWGDAPYTGGHSFFEVRYQTDRRPAIAVIAPTTPCSTEGLRRFIRESERFNDREVRVVAVDAPVTPQLLIAKPAAGRSIDARFSRGHFSNGLRGPQPGSIATPAQGWPLYQAGMATTAMLALRGFPYAALQAGRLLNLVERATIEVIPKLTQTLLSPRSILTARPRRVAIDDHLFAETWGLAPTNTSFTRLLDPIVAIDSTVALEAARILTLAAAPRHEAVGAFVAGLQGALALARCAAVVGAPGDHEGYYVLPKSWHTDWIDVWRDTTRDGDRARHGTVENRAG